MNFDGSLFVLKCKDLKRGKAKELVFFLKCTKVCSEKVEKFNHLIIWWNDCVIVASGILFSVRKS